MPHRLVSFYLQLSLLFLFPVGHQPTRYMLIAWPIREFWRFPSINFHWCLPPLSLSSLQRLSRQCSRLSPPDHQLLHQLPLVVRKWVPQVESIATKQLDEYVTLIPFKLQVQQPSFIVQPQPSWSQALLFAPPQPSLFQLELLVAQLHSSSFLEL